MVDISIVGIWFVVDISLIYLQSIVFIVFMFFLLTNQENHWYPLTSINIYQDNLRYTFIYRSLNDDFVIFLIFHGTWFINQQTELEGRGIRASPYPSDPKRTSPTKEHGYNGRTRSRSRHKIRSVPNAPYRECSMWPSNSMDWNNNLLQWIGT